MLERLTYGRDVRDVVGVGHDFSELLACVVPGALEKTVPNVMIVEDVHPLSSIFGLGELFEAEEEYVDQNTNHTRSVCKKTPLYAPPCTSTRQMFIHKNLNN